MFQQMGKDCTSCRHGVHFDGTSSDSANVKKETIRGEKQKYEKEKTLEKAMFRHCQQLCWLLPFLRQHLQQCLPERRMCRQKQQMKTN